MSTNAVVAAIGLALGRGTLTSIALVLLVLPQTLLIGDIIIEKTAFTLKRDLAKPLPASGRIRMNGHIRGYVNGIIEGDFSGVIEGEMGAVLRAKDAMEVLRKPEEDEYGPAGFLTGQVQECAPEDSGEEDIGNEGNGKKRDGNESIGNEEQEPGEVKSAGKEFQEEKVRGRECREKETGEESGEECPEEGAAGKRGPRRKRPESGSAKKHSRRKRGREAAEPEENGTKMQGKRGGNR